MTQFDLLKNLLYDLHAMEHQNHRYGLSETRQKVVEETKINFKSEAMLINTLEKLNLRFD